MSMHRRKGVRNCSGKEQKTGKQRQDQQEEGIGQRSACATAMCLKYYAVKVILSLWTWNPLLREVLRKTVGRHIQGIRG